MKIGFIGASAVAQTIAKHVLPHGHQVVFSNSRGADTLADLVKEIGPGASAGTVQEASEQDIVVLAVKWSAVQAALYGVADWKGKILVDATNRIAGGPTMSLGDISGLTSSEIVAALAPGAKVVKAFNSVPMAWISDFSKEKTETVLFVSGDEAGAKAPVVDLITQAGFVALDLGSLAIGGRLQQLGGPLAGIKLTASDRFKLP